MSNETAPIAVGLMGTGEYTTGITPSGQSKSDKKIGVVGITMFDLRRRGKVTDIVMAGTNGGKFPEIQAHFQKNIGDVYKGLDLSFNGFPQGNNRNPEAYKEALKSLPKGSAVIIFTPDSTHFPIAAEALNLGHHVLVTKPATQKLEDHQKLAEMAAEKGLVCFVEHHKRFDPAYNDARARAQKLGDFNFYSSYMSQPKFQLETFKSWAGIDSDISYYLNSHHIDIHCWMVEGRYRPVKVTASATTGIATSMGCAPQTEDTITLLVDWQNVSDEKQHGTAVYTASWAAPLKAGVHSEQRFHYMAAKGEVRVDQAHRGYSVVEDDIGKLDYNPFYVKYSPDENGYFDGQKGYGYISLEKFIDAAREVSSGRAKAADYDGKGLPTIKATIVTTALLHAGRISLDEKRSVEIREEGGKLKLI
ncbi:dehydrogenase [Dioszegia hungarica]|uniref:Dehydrogenase n=1 Tax=Dioszegia hungarica TaxID=4972 RepID=A0AA38LUX6_9TREE|nr:dehydrogenase [Dioszegia hungarica]KAI9636435.1 dehydrogenase [Dioszegia hungarica]